MTATRKSDSSLCSRCGTPLTQESQDGCCPRCCLTVLFSPETPASSPAPVEPQPKRRLGDYELLEEIARGGMGIVFRARQLSLNREVALKLMRDSALARPEDVKRFRAEAPSAAKLKHPNIVAIHEVGEQDGQHYFAMDLVLGANLAERTRQGPLPARKAAELVAKIADAVQHAHEEGVLHRDLKPSNVLTDAAGKPFVTDFGLARPLDAESSLTVTGQVLGTPGYMPPEQATGKGTVGPAADIYSLGALLYHLLTGRAPFVGGTTAETLRHVIEQEPVLPHLLNPEVPRDLSSVCLKCLAKSPTHRYASASALADDLQRFLRGEPTLARPTGPTERTMRWCRRKPAFAGLIGAVTLLLLIVAIGSPIVAYRMNNARKLAEGLRSRAQSGEDAAQRNLYASDMNLAQQALKLNNLGRARRLLDRHRPQRGEEDLRGWEWRYLWQLTRSSALVTLTNRPVRGFSVSFSPDGSRLAVGWYDGRVDLWDVPGRQLIRALTDREHPYPHVGRVAFSPVRNLLVAASEPKVVILYDLDSGDESILWRATDQGVSIRDLAFSQDGSRVLISAGPFLEPTGTVCVVNVLSGQVEGSHPTVFGGGSPHPGGARLSPDNRHLYLARSDTPKYRYGIQCLDLTTGKQLWQTEPQPDRVLTALAISPDGRLLASASGYDDSTIRIWEAATGRLLVRLDGHTRWVGELGFSQDGRRLISAATDQTIRFWDASTWTETTVLRGHSDEIHGVAVCESARLVASAGKDGNLMLWQEDGKNARDGYTRLPETILDQIMPLDGSRVLLLPPGKPPELIDLKRGSAAVSLSEIRDSANVLRGNVLGDFRADILCHWNETNQILVDQLRGTELVRRGAVTIHSGSRPFLLAYNATRRLLAWAEADSNSLHLASLTTPDHRTELTSDVSGFLYLGFSQNGNFLGALTKAANSLRVWNVQSGQIAASINGVVLAATYAVGDRVLVVTLEQGNDHEIAFYDLLHPERAPRRYPGKEYSGSLAVSLAGGLVAASTEAGLVRLFDPAKGEWIEDLHGHQTAVFSVAFSPDGRRLISALSGREAVKLWDVRTRQDLLTLEGTGGPLANAKWSADGDVILVGAPWQAWRAPSWEEIAAAEASVRSLKD